MSFSGNNFPNADFGQSNLLHNFKQRGAAEPRLSVLMIVWMSLISFMILVAVSIVIWGLMRRCKGDKKSKPPVVVTSATHTAPGGYPVTQIPPGAGYQTNVYAAPYPTHVVTPAAQMPMPMNMPSAQPPPPGMPAYGAPYPPAAANMNPPSYEAAVAGGPSVTPATTAPYEKQSPYNPSFSAQ